MTTTHNKLSNVLLKSALALAITAACSSIAFAGVGNGRGLGNGNGNGNGETEENEDRPGNGNDPDFVPPGLVDKPRDPRGVGGGTGMGNGDGDDDGDDDEDDDLLRGGNRVVCEGEDPIEGPEGQSGNSHVAHVEFSATDATTGEASTENDAWARMMYFWIGSEFSFVINAHGLEPGSAWTLVAAIEGEGGAEESVCFGEATANNGGQLHINANYDPESNLPGDYDPFAEDDGTDEEGEGTVGFALVPSDSVDCTTGAATGEAPAAGDIVLTSDEGIRFIDTDELTCPTE